MRILVLVIGFSFLASSQFLQGCSSSPFSGVKTEHEYPQSQEDARRASRGKLTGEGGIKLFGGKDEKKDSGSGIGVNSFLWRATLDTLSFMPLAQVDPHGGVIITDWYENPDARGERFKLNVLILGTDLRADGIKVAVFKQEKNKEGQWQDSSASGDTARELEDKILTRARELRISNAG